MKVEIIETINTRMPANMTEIGDMMSMADNNPKDPMADHILLRTYDGLVSLNRPNMTWPIGPSTGPSFLVDVLPKGTRIILTVE